ncbi:MAG: lysozyme [Burkholderiales bacterium]|nr:lysozyme [Burkholderiales bacterium]
MPAAPLRDVPQEAVELIKSFEGIVDGDPRTVNLDAYLDPVGIWTIGWGHAVRFRGQFLRGAGNRGIARALYPGGITRAQAEALLRGDLVDYASNVLALVKVPLGDGAFGALVSFAFNVGVGALAQSTLLRKLNARDSAGAADQFLVWNKGRKNGVLVELPGLTRRRRAERAMFLGQDWRAAALPGAPVLPALPAATRGARGGKAAAGAARSARSAKAGPTPRGRTTTPKAPPTREPAKRPAPRRGR